MKNLFLIIGAPGSGKTTDAQLIAKAQADFTHYSTGDLLRAEVASGSDLGKEVEGFINKGNLVPLAVVLKVIGEALKAAPTKSIIIDGYPRSVEQMNGLEDLLNKEKELSLKAVIEVRVSEDTARDRVLGRARGADDNNEVFNNRMMVYKEPLEELISFYKGKKLHFEIDGEGSIEEIVSNMSKLIKKIQGE